MKKQFIAAIFVAASCLMASCDKSAYLGTEQIYVQTQRQELPKSPVDTTSTPSDTTTVVPDVVMPDDDKILPDEWGLIKGATISAVPSRDVSGDYDRRNLLIITEKGAISVSFDKEEIVPEEGRIITGYFVEGNFSEYNSGLYIKEHDRWEPAIATTEKTQIIYKGVEKTDYVYYTTLKMWREWQNGMTYEVTGYTIDVNEAGVLHIFYNGEQVMLIR
jgi:hypothetical protein